jgi:serine/threonine protein kinase/formylglycine-generating enzyme required for sulfatase activity
MDTEVDAAAAPRQPDHPARIGPYRLLRPLGEGGMGIVYLAEQDEPVQRQVALKLVKLGMDSRAIVARFEQERQALAWMQHDGIARVYDCGTTERGQPYFVMELCAGEPLDRHADRRRLSVRQRIELLLQVCAAVEHAHQKGVVHRDLKPGNVLVAGDGPDARVKVIDFGLAKSVAGGDGKLELHTEVGQVLGTPGYMAPEQAGAIDAPVDTRADIYALGVVLYKLLVGALPFAPRELGGGGLAALARLLREREPARPSTAFGRLDDQAAVAAARATSTTNLLRVLRSDLDWLVHKALERDPARRYATVGAFADDLRRFLRSEPLLAGPPSSVYRLRKLLRRHRGPVLAISAVLVTAVGGAFVALDQAQEASLARGAAEANERQATELAAALRSKVGDYDQLAGVVLLAQAREAAAALHPGWPAQLAALEHWRQRVAAPLLAMRPQLATTLQSLAAERPDLEPAARQFLATALGGLRDDLERFAREDVPAVAQRARFAASVGAASWHGEAAAARWRAANAAIAAADGVTATAAYAGTAIEFTAESAMGLVPIGMNPVTKLWEFYDLRSAWSGDGDPADLPIPTHRPDGSIAVDGATGIVFVLLPGGSVELGAQREDELARRFDPLAQDDETPHRVQVPPFLLARHELTQGQWARLCSEQPAAQRPSRYAAGVEVAGRRITDGHPVEQVDWHAAARLLQQHGMGLPSEARWEYACRAGSDAPWGMGDAPEHLHGHANVLDALGARAVPDWGQGEAFDDGHIVHAPVGSFAPNAFGLYDMHGNVFEWCDDVYGPYGAEPRADGDRVNRGGSFDNPAALARCSDRSGTPPAGRDGSLGIRAARLLGPR